MGNENRWKQTIFSPSYIPCTHLHFTVRAIHLWDTLPLEINVLFFYSFRKISLMYLRVIHIKVLNYEWMFFTLSQENVWTNLIF